MFMVMRWTQLVKLPPSPRYVGRERKRRTNVSWVTSAASARSRMTDSAREYTGPWYASTRRTRAWRSPVLARRITSVLTVTPTFRPFVLRPAATGWPERRSWAPSRSDGPSMRLRTGSRTRPRASCSPGQMGRRPMRFSQALPSGKSTDEALLDGHGDGLGAALGAEFAEDAADVELDRRATDY